MTTRTDPPSPRRLRRARASGDYPRSPLLTRGLVFAVALCAIPRGAQSIWRFGEEHIRGAIRVSPVPTQDLGRLALQELHYVTILSLPVLALIVAAHLAIHFTESHGSIVTWPARPRLFARLAATWSLRGVASLGLQWLSLVALLGYAWFWLRSHGLAWANSLGRISEGQGLASAATLRFAWIAAGVWCSCGCVDLVLAHRAWLRRVRMSRTEKRREQQDLGGNPWLAQQRLERHREARLTLTAVQDATLLTHARFELVVLIRYAARRDPAPRVIGVAVGALASQCISTANDLGIAVSDDEPLTCALARCKPESTIPESLYARVAEILATLPAFTNPPLLDPELAPGLLRT